MKQLGDYKYLIKIMQSEHDSSEDQGFYKPSIQITQPTPIIPTEFASIEQAFDNAIQIISQDRPTDFKPRFLNTGTPYFTHDSILDEATTSSAGELMEPIAYNKSNKDSKEAKQKRYNSLQAKYKNNPDFELVYSKIPQNSEFSSYIFSLEGTTDYNANDFITVSQDPLPQQSIFDCRFESGNLLYAYRKKNTIDIPQYDLILQNDTNTNGYSQWFYFSIKNKQKNKIKLNIVNFIKKALMFLDGVRPVAFSIKSHTQNQSGWKFVGENVSYGKSYITRQLKGNPATYKNYYSLSFQIQFEYLNDFTYIALNFPYTYTRMINHINNLCDSSSQEIHIQKHILCHTISNNPVPYITIKHRHKHSNKNILCLCRQHPGQTVGSFVLQAFLNNLITNFKLLQHYNFYVVPMINPDGVIYGNFRTNLAGFDLNRQWHDPNRWLHPEIFFLSKLVSSLPNIEFCMDFHGHSKKMNSFIYACVNQRINQFRLYPYIFSQNCVFFSLKDCTYNITPDKIKTARVNVFNQIKKPYIFTLETSFFGHTQENKYNRFSIQDFQVIGSGAVTSLQILLTDHKTVNKMEQQVKDKNYYFEQWALQNRQDEGSESNPSQDELAPIQRKAKVMSDAKARKPVRKNLKKKKSKKKLRSLKKKKSKQQLSFALKIKADSADLFEKKKSDKIIPIQVKLKNDYDVVIIQDSSKKMKSQARKQINPTYLQPKIKPHPPVMPRPQQIKTMGQNVTKKQQNTVLNSTANSNLFDTKNYLRMRQQISIQMRRNNEQKLQIVNLKEGYDIGNKKESSSKLSSKRAQKMKRQLQELAPIYSQPKKKSKQKVYIIQQNKVVKSITRINQQEMRRNLQKQISNRTMALKNCQKIMSNMSMQNSTCKSAEKEQDPYKTKKLLRPLDIRKHRSFREDEKVGVFFSFLGN